MTASGHDTVRRHLGDAIDRHLAEHATRRRHATQLEQIVIDCKTGAGRRLLRP